MEDQELKREFTASNEFAIAAFENYKTYLEQELKPKADGNFALGPDLFAKRMAYNEMVDIPLNTETARDCLCAAAYGSSRTVRGGSGGRSNSIDRGCGKRSASITRMLKL